MTATALAAVGSNANENGTLIISGAAQTAPFTAPNTSCDFTGIPSWAKRITVMFNSVSTSGTSNILLQIGSGSVITSGYTSIAQQGASAATSTAGFVVTQSIVAANNLFGFVTIVLISGTSYVESGSTGTGVGAVFNSSGGSSALSGALDRVRITTVNGTDTFDAGTINIMWE